MSVISKVYKYTLAGLAFCAIVDASVLSLCAASGGDKNELKALPLYSSKVTKHGVFPEEVISMKELRSLLDKKAKILIFDARGKKSYDDNHVAGALLPLSDDYYRAEELFRQGIIKNININRDEDLARNMRKHPKDIPIVTYCNDGCESGSVLLVQLKRIGFTQVRVLDEGFQTWQKNGHPVSSSNAA